MSYIYCNEGESRSLGDRAFDLFGEMLLERETAALLCAMEEEKIAGDKEADAFAARCDAKNLALIRRYLHRHHVRTFFGKMLPGIGRVAAIVIAVLTIAGGIAIATSHTIRVQVMKLFTTVEEEYTELTLVEDTVASFDIPGDWEGAYYPAYVPEGMEISSISSFPWHNSVEYVDQTDATRRFNFSENIEGVVTNVDTEDAILQTVDIHGNPATLSIKDRVMILFWDDGKKYFVLSVENLDESTAIQIAEGVTRIE
ncbi:MAG TPA: DUF4367 domain-containing protein [Candidatus Limiplasma sp.]|nr:DUF4367 domain-containing protein [Candidatus Limiplasma sp.]HRX07542.1 DUF4367 domain-containing protein [Candidatus Limiplasma sp.]